MCWQTAAPRRSLSPSHCCPVDWRTLRGATSLRKIIVASPDGIGAERRWTIRARSASAISSPAAIPRRRPSPPRRMRWRSGSIHRARRARPKGVRHVHGSLRATAETYGSQVLKITPDDVMFSAAKAFHAYGLGNSMTFPMAVGARAVLLPDRPTPDAVLDTMRRRQPTIFAGVPTLYASLLSNPMIGPKAGSDRLRRCISAGEALPEDIGVRWKRMVGVDILDGIGSTEMLHIFISNRIGRRALRHQRQAGARLRARWWWTNTTGRCRTASPANSWSKAPAPPMATGTSARNRGATFRGEWTYTGDTYTRDAEGYFRFHGRRDEMLKVSGVWVSPFEVEEALIAHPAVLEAAVVGKEDRDGLTKPRAFVVLNASGRGSRRR